MVFLISKMIAVIITVVLACVLYPIAAVFYIVGLLGRAGDTLFKWTNMVIKGLWCDLKSENY